LIAAAALTLAAPARAQDGKLCVDDACLGMTLAQVAALKLAPAGYGFKFSGKGDFYGLDSGGQRVVYADTGEFDVGLIEKFRASVRTICSFGGATARLTGSDGQRVVLLFQPAIRDGKSELVVAEIGSYLPSQLSDADLQRIKADARARYGAAFSDHWSRVISRPDVALFQHRLAGNSLTLRLPPQDLSATLMAQPGCK
jgi:hypothetical protein